ncbi:hypothetical protein SEA_PHRAPPUCCINO_67 [Mycobacterium phage Phrappuccino]|uniref:Uncharacterized protein n=1 Tax=Mycobacterium phage Phrappuccino TaxID=2591223 RepID=A0A514DDR3_9CAUD|nr:hypothetical protein KHQ87_gp067 [Mycobacterium phage Phrappuccino]QDH91742.1 hypothetical protein SEA_PHRAPPUCCINO_67 [Mycobacterium phage Phrappuccino]QIQ63185.1 hypothetical protein SEA_SETTECANDELA_67 [Mycobacterium phage Settecandela]
MSVAILKQAQQFSWRTSSFLWDDPRGYLAAKEWLDNGFAYHADDFRAGGESARQGSPHPWPEGFNEARLLRTPDGRRAIGSEIYQRLTQAQPTKYELWRGVTGDLPYTEGQTVSMPLSSFAIDKAKASEFARETPKDTGGYLLRMSPGSQSYKLINHDNPGELRGWDPAGEHISMGDFRVNRIHQPRNPGDLPIADITHLGLGAPEVRP